MNRFLIPKISRQLLMIILPLGVSYFLIFQIIANILPPISYDAQVILLALIVPLFLGSHFFWVLFFPGNKSLEQIIFLSTLPVSRKRISRNDIKIYLYIHACVISIILVIGLLFFLPGLLTGMELLRIIVISLWFTMCTLLSYLISCSLKNSYIRFVFLVLTATLVFMPLGVLIGLSLGKSDNEVTVLLGMIVFSLILAGISLLVQRYNENKFMDKDLA